MTAILQFAKEMKIRYQKALYHNDYLPAWISQNQKFQRIAVAENMYKQI
jgi:hypothetical protein